MQSGSEGDRRDPGSPEAAERGSVALAPGAERGALPNLIVIGAQKCGTSGLHFYLGLHPEIQMSQPKEVNFFIRERNWDRGVEWYRGLFDPSKPIRGEASPNYTADPVFSGVPARMHSVVPDVRLIYIVRDPIERIGAHWVHNYAKQRTQTGLTETLRRDRTTYVARSLYHDQLSRFLEYYSLDQVLIIEQEDLRADREKTLRTVFDFAGVAPDFTHPRFRHERHRTDRKTRPTPLGNRLAKSRAKSARRVVPERAWALASGYWPLARRIERPARDDLVAAIPDDVLAELREDAARMRELSGRRFRRWSI
ncbi:sulfotransferase [Thermoleophilia bacterium SCSIO 60948]|nr:sulfotransferase [Thermoleophilia bacterium SCSIO 60948]